ncbi:unnamed protein product [Hymenolepis diminuta]|uniref:Uncharacterized protein n=1 Tax=Hymenolepis diminuta TaxID=6216 RepID=A0A564Z750_HYMDI|nr:unnamed protein product [Hymenolepis diminuta]
MLIDVFKSCKQDRSLPFLCLAVVLLVVFAILLTLSLVTPSRGYDIAMWIVLAISLFIFIGIFAKTFYKVLKSQNQSNEQIKDFDPFWEYDINYDTSPSHKHLYARRNALK